MKKLIISSIAIFTIVNLYSQSQDISYTQVVPMTPNAAEFAKYSDMPISYYTGTPDINIPLYEINVDGFKLPISLNYHASGIRVDQEATWVGLGWSLNVGSRISRTIKSVDDFMINGQNESYPLVTQGYYDAPDISADHLNQYVGTDGDPCDVNLFGNTSIPYYCALQYDPEPDIFYYNLPNMNGKFIIDKSRGAVLFDKSHNLKIEVIKGTGIGTSVRFKITDSEGNQYLYDEWETTQNYRSNGWLNKNIHTNTTKYDDEIYDYLYWVIEDDGISLAYPANPPREVTSWCLSKIITNHGREINFIYDSETQYLPTQEACENFNYGMYNSSSYLNYQRSKVVNNGLRLKTIEGDFGRVEFNASDRFDMKITSYNRSKKLESFSVYNSTNTLIKSFKFDYSYFNDDYSGDYQYEHVFKRLKLNGVKEYKTNVYNPLNNGYTFDYYEGDFPAKNSKNVDYWGYQNGKNYGQNYYMGVSLNSDFIFDGVKKEANFDKAIIGTLKKITYPTGGTSEFKFEGNNIESSGWFDTYTRDTQSSIKTEYLSVYNYYSIDEFPNLPSENVYRFELKGSTKLYINCSLENFSGQKDQNYSYYGSPLGELRKISPSSANYYTYDCPFVYDESITNGEGSEVSLTERMFTLEAGIYEFEAYSPPKDVLVQWNLFFNYLYNPLVFSSPYAIGGIRVKEIVTDEKIRHFQYPNGGTMLIEPRLYYYGKRAGIPEYIGDCFVQVSEPKTPLSTFNRGNFVGYDWVEEYVFDEENNESKIRYNFHNEPEFEMYDDNPVFVDSPTYINYTNGLVKSIEKYTTSGYGIGNLTLIEKEDFSYTSTYGNSIKAFRDLNQIKEIPLYENDALYYHYDIEWPLKTKVIKTQKTDDGNNIVSEINYGYNYRDLLQSTSYELNDAEIIEKVKYPFEFTDLISVGMTAKNMVGMPVESITLKDDMVLKAVKTEYFDSSGLYLPKTIHKAEFNSPTTETNYESFYKPVLNFDKYYDNGNIEEVSKVGDSHVYYVWGYHEQYPIAKLENFTYNDAIGIQSVITDAINASNADTSQELEDAFRVTLTSLRNAAPNAMVTTYTYNPLIGVTSITDPKGYTMFYEYDEYNRLKYVRDEDGNILNENKYHYKQ